jgi:hypothetical protein
MVLRRSHACVGALAVVASLVSIALTPLAGQAPAPTTAPVARTSWGAPDLQGTWTNFDDTPFEQPNPDPKAAAIEAAVKAKRYGGAGEADRPWNAHSSTVSARRPSLIVDPSDGRVPLVPGAAFYRDYDHLKDSWTFHSPGERCITRGIPSAMLPYAYNNGYQILQTRDYVIVVAEMLHDVRIIPMDGRPHVGPHITLWNGDSRGRWDGDTLVVDTTNFNDKAAVNTGSAVTIPQTPTLHVVERFTRVSADLLQYRVTLEDPKVFSRPWTIALPFNREPGYQIYEYACHEGNLRYMEGTLKGGRVSDRHAPAESAVKPY